MKKPSYRKNKQSGNPYNLAFKQGLIWAKTTQLNKSDKYALGKGFLDGIKYNNKRGLRNG